MKFPEQFENEGLWFWNFRARKWADRFAPFVESPIETIMAVSLVMLAEEIELPPLSIVLPDDAMDEAPGLFIATQRTILDYRVDFIVGSNATNRRVVVECDGRDFHHARWDQIDRDRQRDRAIEAAGYPVRRYPGTQIHSESIAIATEIWSAVAGDEYLAWIKANVKYLK